MTAINLFIKLSSFQNTPAVFSNPLHALSSLLSVVFHNPIPSYPCFPETQQLPACTRNPCLNGATCMDSGSDTDSYVCLCADGFTGTNCEETDQGTYKGMIDSCSHHYSCPLSSLKFFFQTCFKYNLISFYLNVKSYSIRHSPTLIFYGLSLSYKKKLIKLSTYKSE